MLASQAFYMYLSNKAHLKAYRYLYLIAVPLVAAFPVILNSQDHNAYTLYEYSVVFCIVFAAIVDSSIAAAFNKEYMTESASRSLVYSYLLICVVTSFLGGAGITVRIIPAFLLASSVLVYTLVQKNAAIEFIKSFPLALLSIFCSWAFLQFGL